MSSQAVDEPVVERPDDDDDSTPIEPVAVEDVRLARDDGGRLVLRRAGEPDEDLGPVVPRRCFPWSRRDAFVALCGKGRRELALIERLADLDEASRALIVEELEGLEFIPTVTAVHGVEETHHVITWRVQTDCGPAVFETQRFDEARDLTDGGLVLKAASGNQYRFVITPETDARSRALIATHLGA